MNPAIKINNLSVTLGGQKILKNISVDLPAGHIIGLLGPSGAGKTTLMRTIIGRQVIANGSVEILKMPAGSRPLRSQIGYMPQSTSIYEDLTVMENVKYFAAVAGLNERAASEVLEEVRMSKYANRLSSGLSGGQKSRVSLAIALLGGPKLLALDEPTVGVDPVLRKQLWQLFRNLADKGSTLLVSSHVMDEAGHCDTLLLIRGGKILAFGSPKDLMKKAGVNNIEEVFLSLVKKEAV